MKTVAAVQNYLLLHNAFGLALTVISVFLGCASCFFAGAYLENGEHIILKVLFCLLALALCSISVIQQTIFWRAGPREFFGRFQINYFVQAIAVDMAVLLLCHALFGTLGFAFPKSFIAVSQLAPGAFVFIFLLTSILPLIVIRAEAFALTANTRKQSPSGIRDRFVSWFLVIYFLLLVAPYSFAPVPSVNAFLTGAGKIPYRAGCMALLGAYSLYLALRYRLRPKFELLIPMSLLLVAAAISCGLSPRNIMLVSENLNGSFAFIQTQIGEAAIWQEWAMLGADCFVLFCFLSFIAPCVSGRKTAIWVMLVIGVYALAACLYSYAFELNAYLSFLDGTNQARGAIHSWSQSKNSFGIILVFGAFAFSFLVFILKRKSRWVLVAPVLVFLITSYLAQCYSSFVVVLVLFLWLLAQIIVTIYRKSRPTSLAIMVMLGCLLALFILFVSVPIIYENISFFGRINAKIADFFSSEIISRTKKWTQALAIVRGPYSFIGKLGSAGPELTAYESIDEAAAANYDYHSAFVGTLASTGLIGLSAYLFFLGFAIKQVWSAWFTSKSACFCMVGLLIATVLFSMPETYTLFLSMSAITLPFTYAFLLFLPALQKEGL